MGTPSKAAFFAELTRAGVPIVDMTAGSRNLGSFTALAVTVHDSVTGGMSDQGAANFCKEGRSDVRGPLYGSLLGKDGRLYVLTLGRSNNTGACSGPRSAAARGGAMPLEAELGAPAADDYTSANSSHYGIAYVTYGAGPYTAVQRERMPLVLAAYIRAAGWSPEGGARSLIGHGEATRRKSDPLLDMGELRRAARAAAESPPVPETPDPEPPPTGDEIDMASLDDLRTIVREEIARVIADTDWLQEAVGSTAGWPDEVTPEGGRSVRPTLRWLADAVGQVRTLSHRVAAQSGVATDDIPGGDDPAA